MLTISTNHVDMASRSETEYGVLLCLLVFLVFLLFLTLVLLRKRD